ncbi:hypothetical protein [Stakelama pacifica]|uniref:Uncharacterized protein n=1 Tax=Stakelama pacifica TaxID=517720 RepID=A0A4R6FN29_9SPHN|nr:hypothetical protein [Stakelama pacifica]TDN83009.1 hypothetical protein EV664_105207 [Stakelama pacifica]GGO94939.1 hypothetical protein GCM10011329_17950 [Stakelama pacifica]
MDPLNIIALIGAGMINGAVIGLEIGRKLRNAPVCRYCLGSGMAPARFIGTASGRAKVITTDCPHCRGVR